MTRQDFIFSNAHRIKWIRHLSFWFLFAVVYYLQSVMPVDEGFYIGFISLCCFLPACVIAAYFLLEILLPWIKSRQYFRFALTFIVFIAGIAILNHGAAIAFFYFTCNCKVSEVKDLQITALNIVNSLHAIQNAGLLFGFRITKDWIIDQKKNQALTVTAIRKHLEIEKTKIYPRFLFQSLHNLKRKMDAGAHDSPNMVLRLSDLLSYLLYESSQGMVRIDREIAMVRNLVDIEIMNQSKHIDVSLQAEVDEESRFVKPLMLFSVLRNCFEMLRSREHEQFRFHLNITQAPNWLDVNISLGQNGSNEKKDDQVPLNMNEILKGLDVSDYETVVNHNAIDMRIRLSKTPVE